MPSFIGSSSIPGNFSSGGLTGITGITGITGNTGNQGITSGGTGGTGEWITSVSSNLLSNQITFNTSTGKNFTFTGFTGATGSWSASVGVSAATGATAYSAFKQVVGGISFEFLGISAGPNTQVSLVSDEIVVTVIPSGAGYGLSGSTGYVPFVRGNTLQATRIYADSNNVLNFGFTHTTGSSVITIANPVFADFKESLTVMPSNNDLRLNGSGGSVLDLSQSTLFWLQTPIGITGFTGGNTLSNTRQSYTIFINGSDVWNLPKNLYFSQGNVASGGLSDAGFVDGINILQIWSDNGGATYDAIITSRGIGSTVSEFNIGEWGSCCVSGDCYDNVTRQYCVSLSGEFTALTACADRTGEAGCGVFAFSADVEGACCCGVTGCISEVNAPLSSDGVNKEKITAAWCSRIGGSFKPTVQCGVVDIGAAFTNRGTNLLPNSVCPNGCQEPLACCPSDGSSATFETGFYCADIGGILITDKTTTEINSIGCSFYTQQGYCLSGGECTETRRFECNCGAFYTTQTACENARAAAIANPPSNKIRSRTPSPDIKIIHSVNLATNSAHYITYTNDVTDPNRTFHLRFYIDSGTGDTSKSWTLNGQLEILDLNIPENKRIIDIWNDTNPCMQFTVFANGQQIFRDTIISTVSGTSVDIDISFNNLFMNTSGACINHFGDVDFAANLVLTPVSCHAGPVSGGSLTVPVKYTKSPCRCVAVSDGSKGTTGDILNKLATTIPFTATRYCTHCTLPEYTSYPGTGESFILHNPYPLKTQNGFITFCPPTTNNSTDSCKLPEYWCVYYDSIKELSGCTYSSAFDANFDNLLVPGSKAIRTIFATDPTGYTGETNIAPTNCFHAEYNAPGEGTTYWFSGDWDYLDINSVYSRARNNLRVCDPGCKVKVPFASCSNYTNAETLSECGRADILTTCCRNCPGQPSFIDTHNVGAYDATCDDNFCFDYQPYFNIVKYDSDVLNTIANTFKIDVVNLQDALSAVLFGYQNGPNGEVVAARTGDLFNPLVQNTSQILGPSIGDATNNPDPDDLAKLSCSECTDKFNKTKNIQIPYLNDTHYFQNTYDVYGMVISKETTCQEEGSYFTGRDGVICQDDVDNCRSLATVNGDQYGICETRNTTWYENKYYAVVLKTDAGGTKINVYDVGSTSEIFRNNSGSQYNASCGGGSMLCNTDCGNGAILREVKWFGTLNAQPGVLPQGFCATSKQLRYTILKDLNGIVNSGTGIYPIDQVISFNDMNAPAASVTAKKTLLGSMLINIFGKEKTDDYESVQFLPCTSIDDAAEGCSISVIPELVEFIGKDCYLSGFDSTTGTIGSEVFEYDNTNNKNEVKLFNVNAAGTKTAKNVYWLREQYTRSAVEYGDAPWLLETPTNTISLNNFYNYTRRYDGKLTNKYQPNPSNTCSDSYDGVAQTDNQTCGLVYNYIDNRFLKTYNLSYLEVKDGKIVKRKNIFQPSVPGITVYGVVNASNDITSNAFACVSDGSGIDYVNSNYDGRLYLSSTCFATPSSSYKKKEVVIPKIDLNGIRPSTKIIYSQLETPNCGLGIEGYRLKIRFANAVGGVPSNRTYVKFLWLNPGTGNIKDITPLIKFAIYPFSMNDDPITDSYLQLDNIVTNGVNNNYFERYPYGAGDPYEYHQTYDSRGFPINFIGINNANLRSYLEDPEVQLLCDDPDNCGNQPYLDPYDHPCGEKSPLATAFENGQIYVLLKEEYQPSGEDIAFSNLLSGIYTAWENTGIVPKPTTDASGNYIGFIFGFSNKYSFNYYEYINIALTDYALSNVTSTGLRETLTGGIKTKRIDGLCTHIDCSEINDICNELESC